MEFCLPFTSTAQNQNSDSVILMVFTLALKTKNKNKLAWRVAKVKMYMLLLLPVLVALSPEVNGKIVEINIHGLGESGHDARLLSFDTKRGNVQEAVERSVR